MFYVNGSEEKPEEEYANSSSSALPNRTLVVSLLGPDSDPIGPWTGVIVAFYAIVCAGGLAGNALVITVALRFARTRSVTDVYVANLAVADLCFVVGLPFLLTTMVVRRWVFGSVLCRLFYMLTSINWFTSVFTLTAMSADRYLAVCHPVRAMSVRTPAVAGAVCACIWALSVAVMSPIVMYATIAPHPRDGSRVSCTIRWPDSRLVGSELAFMLYAFSLGFAVPVGLICGFYAMVVVRLRRVGPPTRTRNKNKHQKVTRLVSTVVAVYICCWLPYWIFQMVLVLLGHIGAWLLYAFQVITVMSYANSSLNPLLYAFLNENFRSNFRQTFCCNRKLTSNAYAASDRKRTIETRWPERETPPTELKRGGVDDVTGTGNTEHRRYHQRVSGRIPHYDGIETKETML